MIRFSNEKTTRISNSRTDASDSDVASAGPEDEPEAEVLEVLDRDVIMVRGRMGWKEDRLRSEV